MFKDKYRVPYNGTFQLSDSFTTPQGKVESDKQLGKLLKKERDNLYHLQRKLYAHDKYAILLIFQAMDAAGKDSTIRTVMRGVNPAGCQVSSFKQPSKEELDHDFLWRSATRLPERGRIGIFNRSYYEETLVVRVHPEYLSGQKLPNEIDPDTIWENRFNSIREHERHLSQNGTVIIKFWLNVSKAEQKNRFLDRLNDPEKNWKFSSHDINERAYWDQYMNAYESMLNATSREYAPWYAIPADNKPYTRLQVARTISHTLESLDAQYPTVTDEQLEKFDEYRTILSQPDT